MVAEPRGEKHAASTSNRDPGLYRDAPREGGSFDACAKYCSYQIHGVTDIPFFTANKTSVRASPRSGVRSSGWGFQGRT